MKFKIENRFQDAYKYSKPPCPAISRDKFIELLSKGVVYLVPANDGPRLNVYKSHVKIAKLYLEKYDIQELIPDEAFFKTMWEKLKIGGEADGNLGKKKYSTKTTQRAFRGIREIVNHYFLSEGIISRPILLEVEWNRYQRFFRLTPKSQKALVWFEENGKAIKAFPVMIIENGKDGIGEYSPIRYVPRISDKKLLPYTNYQKIQQAIRFLETTGKNGFEHVKEDDVERFKENLEKRNLKKKNDYLADIATFYINIKGAGFVSENPFKEISLKKSSSSVRTDYIPQTGIDILYDLSNLDMLDPIEVRNRLITFFCYDTALRIAETASLKVSDLPKDADGEWSLLLKSENQKGREKPPLTMYFYFEKTKELLEHYLTKIRPRFNPRDESLFLSVHSGKGVKPQPFQNTVIKHLAKYGIKTFYGKKATAHHLRHSFGTLNVEPLGIALPVHEISYRYRHTRLEITTRIYVHNNPELIKQKHRAIQKRQKRTSLEVLDSVPLPDIEHWLDDRLGITPDIVRIIRKKHREAFSGQLNTVDKQAIINRIPSNTVDSSYAELIAKSKGVSFRFLKNYCLKKNHLVKAGRSYRFDGNFISDLQENWVPVQKAIEKLKIPKTSLYRAIQERKWPTMRLGKILLVGMKQLKVSQLCA